MLPWIGKTSEVGTCEASRFDSNLNWKIPIWFESDGLIRNFRIIRICRRTTHCSTKNFNRCAVVIEIYFMFMILCLCSKSILHTHSISSTVGAIVQYCLRNQENLHIVAVSIECVKDYTLIRFVIWFERKFSIRRSLLRGHFDDEREVLVSESLDEGLGLCQEWNTEVWKAPEVKKRMVDQNFDAVTMPH